jgi:glycosyltransferase involved in cell wall biosynthesis
VAPKRLCIITHVCRKNDGQGRVNYEIAKAALAAGWKLTLIASEAAHDLVSNPNLVWIKVPASRMPSALLKYQVFAWKTGRWLRRHGSEFDIVHANGFITWYKADVNTAHFVHAGWLHSGYFPYRWRGSPYQAYQSLYTGLNAWLEKRAFRQARAVVAVSGKIAAELQTIGILRSKIEVIANGVDIAEFCPGRADRHRFGLPLNVPLVLFAGDIRTSRKNLYTVLQAMVVATGCQLVVAGRLEGSPYPALARTLGIADRVYFLGMVTEMARLMRSVDLFVFPSRYEAMSLVIVEAMASGLPVLTAKSAGGAEIVADGGRVLENPNDAQTLAKWITELSINGDMRAAMSSCARTIARGYSWQLMGEKYVRLYERLI